MIIIIIRYFIELYLDILNSEMTKITQNGLLLF